MFNRYLFTAIILSLIMGISSAWAIVPVPCRIGGTLTVNDSIVTNQNDEDYTIIVKDKDSIPYIPEAKDKDGLNIFNNYIVDVPIYNPTYQSGGAKPGDIARINAYKNGVKLLITSPPGGYFVVGQEGSEIRIDISAVTPPGDDDDDCKYKAWDAKGDGLIGLEEAIQALQVVSGIKTQPGQ